ncbi:STAT1 protein, partial [Vidua chalybeata]|nr:STAT1 protein [Vidua chalybeata]
QDAAAAPRPPQRELPGLRQSRGTPGATQDQSRGTPGATQNQSRGTPGATQNQSRGTPGATQDRAGAEGPQGPSRGEGTPGPPRTEEEQRDPRDHPGPSRGEGIPGTTYDRTGVEGLQGLNRGEGTTRDRAGAEGPPGSCAAGSMAQWQEVQSLANTYLEQVHQLYAGSALPMAVRQSLAAWIESQNWRQAAEPLCSHARMLFHSLLVLLGERLGSLGSDREDFMLKHNLRKAHRDLQAEFEETPERFANLVANLLQEERRILRLGQAGG